MDYSLVNPPSSVMTSLADARWLRVHVSVFVIGTVLLVSMNLLAGSADLWSLTVTGIWGMLLLVHVIVLIIARLLLQLGENDEETVVVLPVGDAIMVGSTNTWNTIGPKQHDDGDANESTETVSWQIATDTAQHRLSEGDDVTKES